MTYGAEVELPNIKSPLIPNSVNVYQGHTYKKDPNLNGFTDHSNFGKEVMGLQVSKSYEFGASRNNRFSSSKVAGYVALQDSTRLQNYDFGLSTLGQFLYGAQNSVFTQWRWITGD